MCGCSRRPPASCCANTSAPSAGGIASTTPIVRPARRARRSRCSRGPATPARISTRSARYIHDHEGAAGVRRILGVLSLAKKYGAVAADDAAKAALELQVPTYRFLRRYLERRPAAPLTLKQVDPLIRQLTLYRDLIDRTTGDPS